jgi:AbrB family looped-hinge helix DNA binding protein
MNAQTRMSSKGQVVIPKDVRDRLRIASGDRLEVVERPDGVLLRKKAPASTMTFEECVAQIRKAIRYDGPRYTDAEEKAAIAEMFRTSPNYDNK